MNRLLAILLLCLPLAAQSPNPNDKIRRHIEQNQGRILAEFSELLKLENVANNSPKGHADIQRNADHIVGMLVKRGLTAKVLNVDGGFPAVYGEWLTPGASKTVVFYAHFDGQPVDPTKWKTPPFEPTLINDKGVVLPRFWPGAVPNGNEDWRLYARGSSDDKGGVMGLIAAIDALKATKTVPSVNLKFFFEGEEETGSPHLSRILEKHKDLLKSDLWILCDGPIHQSGKLQLVYGARGSIGLELTVFGPNRALHSGHYGNWAPNPALDLAHLLASMRDKNGRITIEGFYDDVLRPTAEEEKALAAFPDVDSALKKELQLSRTLGGARIERSVMEPALNIRGIRAGNVGESATNSIMTEASASIDFRLVPDQTPEKVKELVESHLRRQGYAINRGTWYPFSHVAKLIWQPGYPPTRTSFDAPAAQAMHRTIEAAFPDLYKNAKSSLLRLPTLGGSVPMHLFEQQFNVPAMILPIANYDNNQHASNENIRLGNLWQGIELYAA
ncbi:MAG TPA: M20/M25/M40 family metallo-hydrolase, partial [Terriglobales bacterium]|nr:M20/M25/M40 family metallo-hydrolase [Terriglobales bacterium]